MSCYALALLTVIRLATNSSSRFIPVASNNRSATNPGAPYLDSEMWVSRESANAQTHSNTSPSQSQTPLQLAINAAAGTILGLTLAAFYILPAAYERRFVQIAMAIIPFYRIHDNFLFHHTDDAAHDQVLHTASLIAIALIALTALALTYLAATNKSTPSTNSGAPSSDASSAPHAGLARKRDHFPQSSTPLRPRYSNYRDHSPTHPLNRFHLEPCPRTSLPPIPLASPRDPRRSLRTNAGPRTQTDQTHPPLNSCLRVSHSRSFDLPGLHRLPSNLRPQ